MKKFFRSIAGKTALFIICIISGCVLIASILSAAVMIEMDFYTLDKQRVYETAIEGKIRNDIYGYLWDITGAYKDKAIQIPEDADLVFQVADKNNTVVGETKDAASVKDWRYTYSYGVLKDEEGNLSDLFYTSLSAEENVDYYTVRINLKDSGRTSYYSFMNTVIDKTYAFRYGVYFIGFISLITMIISFVALMSVSGRRSDDEQLYPGPFNRIPFDVMCGAVMLAAALFIITAEEISRGSELFTGIYILCGLLVFMIIGLGLCMSLAVRIKQRNLIKGSFCYMMLKWLIKILQFIFQKTAAVLMAILNFIKEIPLVWKSVIIILGLTFVEFVFLVETYSDFYTAFWCIKNLLLIPLIIYTAICMKKLQQGGIALAGGDLSYRVDTSRMFWDLKKHGENLNSIGKGMIIAVNEQMKSERMKTELITNVSHDIKTPLTSIINYADLISKEKTSNKKIQDYSEVLLKQSERLKRLIDDLVEASKASSGNLDVSLVPCDARTFVSQAAGEFEDRLKECELELITSVPEQETMIMADGRRMWRIFDNLLNNICKYALAGTRVYLDLQRQDDKAVFVFKNTSRERLNISEEELMERFTRGDKSRSSEGNGLGLSIAKSIAELQNGRLSIEIDGDLFKAVLEFPLL